MAALTDFSELRAEVLYAAKQQGIPPEKIKFDWYTLSYIGMDQEPIRAKRDRDGNIVLHVAALMYDRPADPVQEALDYLACFKAAPQTLYVRRQLLNGKAFTDWAKAQGFPTTLFDLHVTIAFSREPVDWKKFTPAQDNLEIKGGERSIEALGQNDEAAVLSFESADLVKRWNEFIDGGASWDWPEYQPHITISFKADGVDLDNVTPYDGTLVFGPEEFAEVKEDWKDTAVEKEFDEGKHPRDDHGRFSESGGGEGSDSSGGEGKHPGEGYSASARLVGGVIHTSSVYDAQRALYENRKVELNQPRSVSVLLKRLGEVAKKMIAEGKEAPLFNLCNVSVKGTNLFCADTKGIPRVEMPQLDADQTKAFVKHLKEIGFKVEKDKVHANHLRATQNEINGAKVAATAEKMRGKEGKINKRLVVSKDDYILDGHHHWAAKVGLDAEDGSLTNDTKVRISRVNISITKLLDEAEKFTGGKGKIGVDAKSIGDIIGLLVREFDEGKHPRDDHGRWSEGGGGGESSSADTGTTAYDKDFIRYSAETKSPHTGISSDFDMRPQQPMPSQSGIVTVNIKGGGVNSFHDVATSINPTTSTVKHIIKESHTDAARTLQDRAGNLVVFPAGVIHQDMMDALAPMETMWASDIWEIRDGKITSVMGSGTAMAADWIAKGQENNKNADRTSVGFVSPNVKPDLDFNGAVEALTGPQQGSLLSASATIDRGLGIVAKEASTIGAWSDGAENSVMMTAGSDWDHTVAATVMKGHLADQKQVMVFQQQRGGEAVLASFRADGKLEDIHNKLLEDGLAFHTLVPSGDGATVYVADTDGSLADAVEKASGRYDAKVNIQYGRADFIGDTEKWVGSIAGKGTDREQRDRARGVYEQVIKQSKVSGSAAIWADVRDRWGTTSQKVKEFDESKHPRGQPENAGQFGSGGGGSGAPETAPAEVPAGVPVESFDANEQKSLVAYVDNAKAINRLMRGKDLPKGESKAKLKAEIDAINSALKKGALVADTTLWRGVYGSTAEKLKEGGRGLVGKTVPLGGFQSTSLSKQVARTYASDKGEALLEIVAPKGTLAIDMSPFAKEEFKSEQEVLLGQGNLKIESVKTVKGVLHIRGTYAAE